MEKKTPIKIISGLLILALFVTSCTNSTTTSKVVCNKPYILVGTECCLDRDDNSICDKDELVVPNNQNQQAEVSTKETYSISDLQADIGNTLLAYEFIVLQKGEEINGVSFYTYSPSRSTRLGDWGGREIFKVLPKTFVVVSVANDESSYINPGQTFLNFIEENEDYLTRSLDRDKEELINSFSEGGVTFDIIKQTKKDMKKYNNHEAGEEEVIIDEIKILETVTDKVVTRDYVSLNPYIVNYEYKDINKDTEITGLNYLQSVSVFCTPEITITLYHAHPSAKISLDSNNLDHFYKNNKDPLISDGQALISMCEDRYDFSYQRIR